MINSKVWDLSRLELESPGFTIFNNDLLAVVKSQKLLIAVLR